jgi:hypothetical protein
MFLPVSDLRKCFCEPQDHKLILREPMMPHRSSKETTLDPLSSCSPNFILAFRISSRNAIAAYFSYLTSLFCEGWLGGDATVEIGRPVVRSSPCRSTTRNSRHLMLPLTCRHVLRPAGTVAGRDLGRR